MPRAIKIKPPMGYVDKFEDGEYFIQPVNFTKDKRTWYLECQDVTIQSNSGLDEVLRVWAVVGQPKVFSAGNVG